MSNIKFIDLFDERLVARLEEMHDDGWTLGQMSRELKCGTTMCRILLNAKGRTVSYTELTADEMNRIKSLYQDGVAINDIASEMNRSVSSIRSVLTKSRLYKPANRYNDMEKEKNNIINLYKDGWSVADILKVTNRKQTTVYSYIKQYKSEASNK